MADTGRYNIRFLDKVQVKGKYKPVDLYEVYSSDLPDFRSLKQDTQQEYEQALIHFYAREFVEAQAKLFWILQKNPKYKVAWHHLVKATECLDNGVPENWTGITAMASK